jgi:beta-lactamase regulating signal transducer with metallopeptidase domain
MNIYVHKDGTQYGPYSIEQVHQYIQQGAFTLQDQACHDGQNWVLLSQVPGLSQPASVQPQPQAQVAPNAGNAQNKFNQSTSQAQPTPGKGSNKKLIIWGSVGAVALIVMIVSVIFLFSGDDEENGDQVVNNETKSSRLKKALRKHQMSHKKNQRILGHQIIIFL